MAGVQDIPLNIPGQWDPVWFRRFVQDVLSKLDPRNATATGLTISSDGNSVADFTTAVTQASVDASIDAHEAAADPHPTYLTQAEADALYEPTASILPVCLVSQLPTAAVGNQGVRGFVTDANSTTFYATAVGGGANAVPVVSTGAAWVIG